MEIWGKRGVKEACLMLEYSHQRSREKVNFSRNISIPVKVTVYPSIELVGCDIIPLSSTTKISQNNEGDCWNYLNQLTKEGGYEMSDFCLLALDFINSWTEVIEITFQSLFSGSKDPEFQDTNGFIEDAPADTFYSRIILASKKNSRVLIPIKRIDFGYDYLDRRVPSLRNKQFIFDSKTPEAEQRFIKHAFWYRDELLKRMRATWKIPESISNSMYAGRAGTIDLRSIRFSSKMVNALEVEKVGISLSLRHHSNNPVDYENIQIHEFYTVELKLTNRNKKAINGIIRHVPICRSASISIEKKILYNGVLQFSLEDSMEPGDSRVFKLGITFLEKGEYEWGAMFDEMDGYDTGSISIKHQHLEREQLKLKVC
ncbi:hypothetical protein CANARDRAFT_175999 [[Candida] arabinofermentans NRRL YB-2248]|uniref:Uncharacterized protein n=1 Tax=[Candida] arabinofermentans NRRL YB-2248 TaxID=983967 RepID=A0A1E4T1G8_9ASCO|nr:hypothetical protein CANARDRAFT_175999 [[Candida] arabinofermentans NRRL YB-2248]